MTSEQQTLLLNVVGTYFEILPPGPFDARMKEVGASHTLIIKSGRGHTGVIDETVWDFFKKTLW